MRKAIILIVDDDTAVRQTLVRDVRRRYGRSYRLVEAGSAEEALAAAQELKQRRELLALTLADHRMPGRNGTDLLLAVRDLFPNARKALLTAYADTEAAITSINQVGIDRYLVKPWQPPEERLFPALDELLADWQATVQLPAMRVRGIMTVPPVRIRHDASLHHAAEVVALSGAGDLMVVDDEGDFVGALSEGDILRAALPDVEDILEEGGTPEDAFQLFLRRGRDLADKPILPLVIREPLVVQPDDHVAKVATLLINRQIRRLPVLHHGRLVGTVSRANICQAVIGIL